MYLGDLYLTRGIVDLIGEEVITKQEVMECVFRHMKGDYGLICEEDVEVNNRNLDYDCGQVLSEYVINGIRTWVITNLAGVKNTYSTVLLPQEY